MKKSFIFLLSLFVLSCSSDDSASVEVPAPDTSAVSITINGNEIIFNRVIVGGQNTVTDNPFPYTVAAFEDNESLGVAFSFDFRQYVEDGPIFMAGQLDYMEQNYFIIGNNPITAEITEHTLDKFEGTFEGKVYRNGQFDENESIMVENGMFDLILR